MIGGAEATGLGDYKVLYALYRLFKAGLVHAISGPAEESADEALGELDLGGDLPESVAVPDPDVAPVLDTGPWAGSASKVATPLRGTMEMPT